MYSCVGFYARDRKYFVTFLETSSLYTGNKPPIKIDGYDFSATVSSS
jgi:hypothetical protein